MLALELVFFPDDPFPDYGADIEGYEDELKDLNLVDKGYPQDIHDLIHGCSDPNDRPTLEECVALLQPEPGLSLSPQAYLIEMYGQRFCIFLHCSMMSNHVYRFWRFILISIRASLINTIYIWHV